MNSNFLFELLVDPLTKEPLHFDVETNTFRSSSSGKVYPLIGSIPRILIENNQQIFGSDLHKTNDSVFMYSDHYQKDADLFDYTEQNIPVIAKNEFIRLRESIIREISRDSNIILDVGCGNGWLAKKLIPLGKKVISMDISTTNPVNALKQVNHQNHAGLIADAFNIPIKENSVDCIIASEIMEHVPDPKLFISSLIKLLKPRGKLIITTPYNEKIEYCLCVHCNKPTPRFAHLHSFNEENVLQFIPENGVTWSFKKFLNKFFIQSRSHLFMKFLPYGFWKISDNLFNKFFNNPTRLQIVIIKES
jgi:2-polyprenyl-3-methyl-5-hydroxy-6-metoxy-1,4-benzoquinol methylase